MCICWYIKNIYWPLSYSSRTAEIFARVLGTNCTSYSQSSTVQTSASVQKYSSLFFFFPSILYFVPEPYSSVVFMSRLSCSSHIFIFPHMLVRNLINICTYFTFFLASVNNRCVSYSPKLISPLCRTVPLVKLPQSDLRSIISLT